MGLEPTSYLYDQLRSTTERANGAGFELGPDAYRDDGLGAAPDGRTFRPRPTAVEPPRPEQPAYEQPRHDPPPPHQEPPAARPQTSETAGGQDDDAATSPLPVILPGATRLPRPAPVEAPRGPFEPARPSQQTARPASVTGSVEPPPATFSAGPPPGAPWPPPAPRALPEAAAAKLDQLKDLYLTAEAIGEDALDKHFGQVSERQRELIREFFERSKQNGNAAPG